MAIDLPELTNSSLELDDLGGRGGTKKRRKPPKRLSPEERESLLRRVGGITGSGLQYVAETLDKPGRAARGLLAGKPGELANLIPFSDTFGITNPNESVSGRQLLEHHGVLGKNRPGLDLGDVAGFGAEILTDPMTWLVGPGRALSKSLSMAKPIVRTEKTLRNYGSLQEAIQARANITGHAHAHISGLEQAAQGARLAHDAAKGALVIAAKNANPALANRTDEFILKHVLSAKPLTKVNGSLKSLYRSTSRAHKDAMQKATDAIDQMLPKQEIIQQFLEHPGVSPTRVIEEIKRGDRGLIGVKLPFASEPFATFGKGERAAKLAESAYYKLISRSVRNVFDHRLRGAGTGRMAQQIADSAYAHKFDELANVNDQLLAIHKQLPDIQKVYDDLHKAYPTMQPKTFEEAFRDAAETKGFDYMQKIAQQAQATPDVLARAKAFDDLAHQVTKLQDEAYAHARSLGMKGSDLDDLIGHTFRAANPLLHKLNKGAFESVSSFGGSKRRATPLRGMLTSRIRQASTTANPYAAMFPGAAKIPDAELEDGAKWLATNLGVTRNRAVRGPNGTMKRYDQAKELAKIVMALPKEVAENGGLFPRATVSDAMNYLHRLTTVRGALMGFHDMVHRFADVSPNTVGPTVAELFQGMQMKGGVPAFIKKWADAHSGAAPDLTKLRVPQELADSAAKVLRYNAKPEEMGQIMKVFSAATGLMKGGLTVPFPAFHSRNAISGLWQNAVTAFNNPAHAAVAMKDAMAALLGKNPELIQEMHMHGLLPSGGMAADILGSPGAADFKPDQLLGNVFNPFVAPGRAARNFKSGQGATGKVSNLVRGEKNQFGERMGGLGQWGRDATNLVEFFNRASHFAARKRDGWSNAMAARSTKAAHFDYSELGEMEKKYLRPLVLFYTFSRKNLPLQLRELLNQPGGPTAKTIRAMAVARREGSAGAEGAKWLPARLGENTAFMLPGQNPENRTVKFLAESGLLPVSEAFNRFSTKDGIPDPKLIAENFASMLHPLAQEPLSHITNRSFWKHAPRDEYYPWPTNSDTLNAMAAMAPHGRAMALARMLGDERKSNRQKLFNFLLGGVRVTDVDLRKEELTHLRRALDEALDRKPGMGEFSIPYVSNLARVSPESLQDLLDFQKVVHELSELKGDDLEAAGQPRRKAPKRKTKNIA